MKLTTDQFIKKYLGEYEHNLSFSDTMYLSDYLNSSNYNYKKIELLGVSNKIDPLLLAITVNQLSDCYFNAINLNEAPNLFKLQYQKARNENRQEAIDAFNEILNIIEQSLLSRRKENLKNFLIKENDISSCGVVKFTSTELKNLERACTLGYKFSAYGKNCLMGRKKGFMSGIEVSSKDAAAIANIIRRSLDYRQLFSMGNFNIKLDEKLTSHLKFHIIKCMHSQTIWEEKIIRRSFNKQDINEILIKRALYKKKMEICGNTNIDIAIYSPVTDKLVFITHDAINDELDQFFDSIIDNSTKGQK